MTIRKRESGMSLIGILVYIAVLSGIMVMGSITVHSSREHHLRVTRVTDDITRTISAGERWREDIRSADAPPMLADGVLVIPHENGETAYRFADGNVQRRNGKQAQWQAFLTGVATSRMLIDKGKHVTSWRWEIELESGIRRRIRPLFSFQAVPSASSPW